MKVAASTSVGRLAPKHTLNIDGIRAISPNVTPRLIRTYALPPVPGLLPGTVFDTISCKFRMGLLS